MVCHVMHFGLNECANYGLKENCRLKSHHRENKGLGTEVVMFHIALS